MNVVGQRAALVTRENEIFCILHTSELSDMRAVPIPVKTFSKSTGETLVDLGK